MQQTLLAQLRPPQQPSPHPVPGPHGEPGRPVVQAPPLELPPPLEPLEEDPPELEPPLLEPLEEDPPELVPPLELPELVPPELVPPLAEPLVLPVLVSVELPPDPPLGDPLELPPPVERLLLEPGPPEVLVPLLLPSLDELEELLSLMVLPLLEVADEPPVTTPLLLAPDELPVPALPEEPPLDPGELVVTVLEPPLELCGPASGVAQMPPTQGTLSGQSWLLSQSVTPAGTAEGQQAPRHAVDKRRVATPRRQRMVSVHHRFALVASPRPPQADASSKTFAAPLCSPGRTSRARVSCRPQPSSSPAAAFSCRRTW